jgi:RNA polymerase sigma-70 factor (ECF subfamily)
MADSPSIEQNDEPLIRAVQRGDAQSFEPLVDRHLQHVRTFVALKAPVPHLVAEITHETFVFAFRRIAEFKAGTSFRAWLRAIAWNLLRAEIQRFSREQAHQSRYFQMRLREIANALHTPPPAREMDFLEECLEQLPPTMQKLMTMKYREEHSAEQIAATFQRTPAWVHTTLFRLRQQLRECIEGKLRQETPC